MELFLQHVIILIITGSGVGLATGILGIGGGFLLVPLQFFLLQSMGMDPEIALPISLGTSLAVIIPTSLSGAYSHHLRRNVLIKPALYMGTFGFLGGWIGGYLATITPVEILTLLFAALLFLIAYQFLKFNKIRAIQLNRLTFSKLMAWGFLAGITSGFFGIGGGIILVPIMLIFLGFKMVQAVGTSTLAITLSSLGGMLSYIYWGWNIPDLPPYSVGYVNLILLFLLSSTSIPMAHLGTYYAHRIPEKRLKQIFAIILIYIGLRLTGLFEILGIPF